MAVFVHASKSNPCPICATTKGGWCYPHPLDPDNSYYCKRPPLTPPLGWYQTKGIDKTGDGYLFKTESSKQEFTDAQKAEYAEQRESEKRQRETTRKLKLVESFSHKLTAQQRDPIFRSQVGQLTDLHRQALRDRGLTDEQIDTHKFRSGNYDGSQKKGFGKSALWWGIFIPTIDTNGLMTGYQFMADGRGQIVNGKEIPKYIWGKDQTLPVGEGELPIQVFNAQVKSIDRSTIWAMEGTLKPLSAAHLHQISVIGASGGNFAASPVQFAEAVSKYDRVVIAIDAGDAINPQRVTHWKRQAEFLATLGIEVEWAWWEQETKDSNDIDEMSLVEYKSIKRLNTEELLDTIDKIAAKHKNLGLYKELATLKSAATLKYNDEWVRDFKFKPGTILLINSGVGTGKTGALGRFVEAHKDKYNHIKIWALLHRIMLARANAKRLGLDYIADLKFGFENLASINASEAIALCVDSLHNIDTRDIPPKSIVMLDEIEAVLAHLLGGTLGDRAAHIQTIFVSFLRAIIAAGGMIVGAEDTISQITVDTLRLICHGTKIDIIVNTHNKFNYPVQIGGHTNTREFVGAILDRLQNGERIIIPTTSQKFGHKLHKLLLIAFPTLRIARIDSRTTLEYSDFMDDPTAWLVANQIDVLIYSPAIESGVSIVDLPGVDAFFSSMFLYIANLNTRSQVQLLHRYRGNCPRYIFSPKKLSTAKNSYRSEVNYRLARSIAIEESLRHGHSLVDTEIGDIFNLLAAKFKARDALSAAYNREILIADLQERGHSVAEVKWEDTRTDYQAEHTGKYWIKEQIGEGLKECAAAIIEEDATAMATADCSKLSVSQAKIDVNDPTRPFDLRWGAKKKLHEDALPGFPVDDVEHCKFLLDKQVQKIQCRLYMHHPELAKATSGIKIEYQQTQPHILHYRTPTDEPLAILLQPIVANVMELVNSDGYTSEHPAAIAIADYCLANSFQFYRLKRLQFKAPAKDSLGNTHHTPVASANKIIRMLGWDAAVISKVSGDRVYKVANVVDPIADVYIECRMRKLVELQSKHTDAINRRIVKDVDRLIDNDAHSSYDVGTEEDGEDPLSTIKLMAKQLRTLNGIEYDNYEAEVLDYARNNNLEFIKPEGRVGIGFGKWQIAA